MIDDVFDVDRSKLGLAERKPAPPRRRVALVDLRPGMCRWPLGDPPDDDFGFCGAPAQAGSSYCEECRKRAYLAPRANSDAIRPGIPI